MSTNGRRSRHRRVQVRLALEHLVLVEQREHRSAGCGPARRAPVAASSGRPPRARKRCGQPRRRSSPGSSRRRRRGPRTPATPGRPRGPASRSPSASSPLPRPYQPGRLTRVIDQANTHGIARRSARLRPDSAPLRRLGREPSRRSASRSSGARRREEVGEPGLLDEGPEGPRGSPSSTTAASPAYRSARPLRAAAWSGASVSSTADGDPLEVLLGDPDVGVPREDHLALLGHLEPAVDRPGRLGARSPGAAARRRGRASRRGRGTGSASPRAARPTRRGRAGPGTGPASREAGPTSFAESE